jgi:hypothetical protein
MTVFANVMLVEHLVFYPQMLLPSRPHMTEMIIQIIMYGVSLKAMKLHTILFYLNFCIWSSKTYVGN